MAGINVTHRRAQRAKAPAAESMEMFARAAEESAEYDSSSDDDDEA